MGIIINLLLLQFIIVCIIDISGFIRELEDIAGKWLKIKNPHIPKPFSCSFCSTWWTGLIYLIISGSVTLYHIAALLMICCLTTITAELIYLIQDILIKILQIIRKIISLK